MLRDYVIGIGGTGARCVEATIYLAAAGLFERPLHILLIDPDQNNGNVRRTKELVSAYHRLKMCSQPQGATQRRRLGGKSRLLEPTIFQTSLNENPIQSSQQSPFFWQDPSNPHRTFNEVIDYDGLSPQFRNFVDLFYEEVDLNMKLGKGYRGRPNIGAVTLISDLRRTVNTPGRGLFELKTSIELDAKENPVVRVFVFGSVFGGTGAAGLPTIVELLLESVHASDRLRFGGVMMAPYFTFPEAEASEEGPSPDSRLHQVATQAALLHYAQVPPGYQHVYMVGAPNLTNSKAGHQAGGEEQENDSHYAEVMAGLAARDFFALDLIEVAQRELHYADGEHFGFDTMPALSSGKDGRNIDDQKRIKSLLLNFTSFVYLYGNILHNDCKDIRWYSGQAWYKDNFLKKGLSLEKEGQLLDELCKFSRSYLDWLDMIGQPIKTDDGRPFNWSAIPMTGLDAERQVGNLTTPEADDEPRYINVSYGSIMDRLHALHPTYSNVPHPVGLLIYLLYEAVSEFCKENYQLAERKSASA